MAKPKIGLYWCSGCGGCEESVVDLAENILAVAEAVDIVFWPVAMDFKYADVEAMPDRSLAAVLINGSIRLSEQEEIARLLRRKAQVVIAHGTCAYLGGIVGLGNFSTRRQLLEQAYEQAPSLARGGVPGTHTRVEGHDVELPRFMECVRPLDQVIEVDYVLPGCPPTPELLLAAITALLEGRLPPRGAVLAEDRALCDSCARRETKPENLGLTGFHRVYEAEIDQEKCFLAQGLICMGPVTRGGCKGRCLEGNLPCSGCFGPLDGVREQGAKFISTLGGTVELRDPEAVEAWVRSIPDPAGQLYRYSLATSALRGAVRTEAR